MSGKRPIPPPTHPKPNPAPNAAKEGSELFKEPPRPRTPPPPPPPKNSEQEHSGISLLYTEAAGLLLTETSLQFLGANASHGLVLAYIKALKDVNGGYPPPPPPNTPPPKPPKQRSGPTSPMGISSITPPGATSVPFVVWRRSERIYPTKSLPNGRKSPHPVPPQPQPDPIAPSRPPGASSKGPNWHPTGAKSLKATTALSVLDCHCGTFIDFSRMSYGLLIG